MIALLMVSCSSFKGTSSSPKNFREGSEGITISFLPSLPKEIIVTSTSNERISFFVQLRNKGTYPDEGQTIDGSLWLSGFDPIILAMEAEKSSLYTSEAQGNLQGRTATNSVGGSSTYEFQGTINSNDQILSEGKYSPTILANVCYRYETVANPVVCVEKEPYSISNQKKPCVVSDINLASQGAPIAVTKVETVSTTGAMQFKITLKNLGKGTIIDTSVSCQPSAVKGVQRHQLDLVTLTKASIGDQELSCTAPDQKIRLIDGVGYFTCSIEKSKLPQQQAAFTTPFDITLSYLYKETIEKPITITKIAN